MGRRGKPHPSERTTLHYAPTPLEDGLAERLAFCEPAPVTSTHWQLTIERSAK